MARYPLLDYLYHIQDEYFVLKINIKPSWFQDKHLWIKSSNIGFKPSMYLATPIIYLDNLFLKSVDWLFENINVQISSCLLGSAHLKIYKNLSNQSHAGFYEDLYVSINDSSLGTLRADSVSQIIIRNSYINGRYTESSSSLFRNPEFKCDNNKFNIHQQQHRI